MSAAATEGRESLLSHDTFLTSNILLQHQPSLMEMEQSTTPPADPIELQQLQLLTHPEPLSPGAFSVVDPSLLGASPAPSSPAPSGESKSVKKRKSWGQVLPEPKTNLPPRKRAKTEDEKEQRRIERVKRNRLAAHNSRERKRVEMEDLQEKNNRLEAELAALRAELTAMRNLVGGKMPSSVSFAAQSKSKTAAPIDTFTPPPSIQSQSTPSMLDDMATPPSDSFSQPATPFETPMEALHLQTPDIFSLDDSEPTQHSAAMLCDLQCRSDASKASTSTTSTSNWNLPPAQLQRFQQTLATFSLFLLHLQISVMTAVSTTCSTLISSSLRQHLSTMTSQARRTPAISFWTRSLRASTSPPSRRSPLSWTTTQLMFSTMQRLLLCTPAMAPRLPSKSATGVAPRQESSNIVSLQQLVSLMMTAGGVPSAQATPRLRTDDENMTLDRRRPRQLDDGYDGLTAVQDKVRRWLGGMEEKDPATDTLE